jgi:glutamate-1-semialdehyde aminotransferase
MKITKQQNPDGTLYENDTAIEQAITLAAGTTCVHLLPGESHFEPTIPAPTGDEAAVAAYAAWADKRV